VVDDGDGHDLGSKIAIIGGWRHFVIVERLGLTVELIAHLFGSANRYPTGQRGLWMMARNSSKVIAENAFRFLGVK
jgi:predicted phage gp36 major capsid-like protein